MTRAEAGGSIGMRHACHWRRQRLLGLFLLVCGSLLLWTVIAYVAVRAWQQFAVSG
jgi:hypothetical protein